MDFMKKLGSDSTFSFLMMGMAEKIRSDETLSKFFGRTMHDIVQHQTKFMKLVFASSSSSSEEEEEASSSPPNDDTATTMKNDIMLIYYRMICLGFNEYHFDLLVDHFIEECRESWIDEDIIQDAVSILNTTARPVFITHHDDVSYYTTTTTTTSGGNNDKTTTTRSSSTSSSSNLKKKVMSSCAA